MNNQPAEKSSSQIAFVFDNVASYQQLVAVFRPGVEVHVLDAGQDGLAQIASLLEGRSGVEALHVVGHGASGSLNFGSVTLDSANVGAHAALLGRIGAALAEDGDILLYGCDTGADAIGAQFVGQIAQATGADVAASSDSTGGAQRGGDWVLEYRTGAVTAEGAFDAAAVRTLNTLLALPSGRQDVTSTMNEGAGNFLDGFTLNSDALDFNQDDPLGLYFNVPDSTIRYATFTVAADDILVASFNLTGMEWAKYTDEGSYSFTVKGYRGTTQVAETTFTTANDSTTYTAGDYAGFTDLTSFTVELTTTSTPEEGFPISQNTFDAFSIANVVAANTAPEFADTTTQADTDQNTVVDVSALLRVDDPDTTGQTLTWSPHTAPTNGTLTFTDATATSGGTDITPTITYTPNNGFIGSDTFEVKVSDGFAEVIRTVTVTVKPDVPTDLDLSAGSDTGGSDSDNITSAASLVFSGKGAIGDSSSTVRVFVDTNGNGTYDSGSDVSVTTTMSNGNWTTGALSTSSLASGTYNVYAQTTGGADDDTSAPSAPLAITIDKTAPSLTITSSKPSLKAGETATITFAFTEDPGTSFSAADVVVSGGGTLEWVTTTGLARTATFTPAPDTNGGSASISVAAGAYSDAAGNNGGEGTPANLSFDTKAPTLTISTDTAELKAGGTALITFTFSEDPLDSFAWDGTSGDVAVTGGTLSAISGSGTTRTATFTPDADSSGTASIGVSGSSYTDAAGNNGADGIAATVAYDTLIPTLAITSDVPKVKIGEQATITFTFSHDPGVSFTSDDITVMGGTLSDFGGSGLTRTVKFTPDGNTDAGAANISVAGGSWTGSNGNAGAAGSLTTLTFDTKAPTVIVTASATDLTFGQTALITFELSEDVAGSFTDSDISVTGGTLGPLTGSGTTRTAVFTPFDNQDNGTATIAVATGALADTFGNGNAVDASVSLDYDTLVPAAPTLALATIDDSGTSSSDNVTMQTSFSVTGMAENGMTITLYDGATQLGTTTVSSGSWTIAVSGRSDGAHTFTATATDAAGNVSDASTGLAVTVDTAAPTLAITSDKTGLKAGESATITFTFSEDPGSTLAWDGTSGDITVSGGTLSVLSGTGPVRTAVFTPAADTNGGVASISVTSNKWTDAAGNQGAAATLPSFSFDTLAPTVTISSDKDELKAGEQATITFTFNEDPGSGFTLDSVIATGGTLTALGGTGNTRTATFIPTDGVNAGSASISVAAGDYTDTAGNGGGEGTAIALTYDTLAPGAPSAPALDTADDTGQSDSDGKTNSADLRFSGNADAGSTVTLYDGAVALDTVTATDGTWAFTVSGLGEGSHSITAIATDSAGNSGTASTATEIVVDRTAPTLDITSDKTSVTAGGSAVITFSFSEDPGNSFVWDGTSGSILVSGGSLSAIAGTGNVRTAVFTPTAGVESGTATISVPLDAWSDVAGNDGGSAVSPTLSIDTVAPQLDITASATTLRAGQVATITFTFTEDPGLSFSLADIAVSGGTLADLTTSGNVRTAVFTPSEDFNGTATITVAAGAYTDVAGNNGETASSPVLTVNTVVPAAPSSLDLATLSDSGVSDTDDITSENQPTITGTAEDGATVRLYDGDTEIGSAVAAGGTWSIIPTAALSDGTHELKAVATNAAGNSSAASGTLSVKVDTSAPTVDITSSLSSLKAGETAIVTFTFSEDPGSSFVEGDITVAGGTLSGLSGTGNVRTAVFTPDADIDAGTASISLAAGSYTDLAGNSGGGDAVDLTFDTKAPATPSVPDLSVASDSGALDGDGVTKAESLVFTGSADAGTTVQLVNDADDTVLGTAVATGGTWTITLASLPEGPIDIAAIAVDAAGNNSAKSAAVSLDVDRTAPAAPVLALADDTGASGSDGVTTDGQVNVSGIDAGAAWEYSLNGGTSWNTGAGSTFTIGADGEYSLLARQVDVAGNASAASAPFAVTRDTTAPHATVTLDRATIGKNQTATITIDFGENVSAFDVGDIAVDNGTLSDFTAAGEGRWTVTLTPTDDISVATNMVRVTNTGVTDDAGNVGSGTSDSPNYQVRTAGPVADITIADTELKAGETTTVTIQFSEAVNGFTLDDITVENGTLAGLSSTDNKTWTATLTPSANVDDTTNLITINNSGVTGQLSESAGGGTSDSDNYVVSTVRPTVSISLADTLLGAGESTTVTIVFSEAVTGFDLADLTAARGTLSALATTDNITWTATFTAGSTAAAALGRVTVNLPSVQNAAGNSGAGPISSPTYVVLPDDVAPPPGGGGSSSGGVSRQPFTDPVTGLPSELVNVQAPPAGSSAQVSLGSPGGAGGSGSLTATLPGGAGLQVSGPTAPLNNAQALLDLIARIEDTTPDGSATQTHMTSLGQSFLSGLEPNTMLQTKTITPSVAPGSNPGQPIVITGAAPSAGSPAVGLVIDGSGLPAGTTLQLDNVDFAAVVGDMRLIGGAGRNYVVGDGGTQTIYLGPDDDVLNGGGGNDFIGSGAGDDQLDGGADNDLVAGGAGNDTVFGGAGADLVSGGRSATGNWSFYVSANGNIVARHSGAVFVQGGTEVVQASELDASVPELGFITADVQHLVGVSLLYAALGRAPDLGGLTFWSQPGTTLTDVANGVLASPEWLDGPLGQLGNEAYVREIYEHVLGRAPDADGLAYWVSRLDGTVGQNIASRTEVLAAVALSDEHRAKSLTADGFAIGTASLSGEGGWFAGSGNDRLDGGAGSDQLVGGDGTDTAVFAGLRTDYRVVIDSGHQLRVVHAASGDVDTLSSIEAAEFGDSSLDLTFLDAEPGMVDAVGLLYQAVLDRASDAGALNWWLSQGLDKAQLAQAFTSSAEFQSRFGTLDDAAFMQALYANSGLATSDAGGIKSWEAYLANHTRAELVATWISHDSVIDAQFGNGGLWLV